MTSEKDKIISKVYYDTAGYGSVAATLADAKTYDSSITYADVKKWKDTQTVQKHISEVIILLLLINLLKSFRWI